MAKTCRSGGLGRAKVLVLLAGLGAVAGCAPQVTVHGYVPNDEDLSFLEPGVDTVFSVEERIGRPSTSGFERSEAWYYVQTTISQLTYNPPRVTDREVVAVSFDEDGVVVAVDRFGLERGRVVALNPRTTPTSVERLSLIDQIFGSLFNVDAGQILGRGQP